MGSRYHAFFNHIDNFKDPAFMYLTNRGTKACEGVGRLSSTNTNFQSRKSRMLKLKARGPSRNDMADETEKPGEAGAA